MAGNFNFNFGRDLFGKKTLPKKSPPALRFVLPNHNDYEVENEPEEEDEDDYVSTGMYLKNNDSPPTSRRRSQSGVAFRTKSDSPFYLAADPSTSDSRVYGQAPLTLDQATERYRGGQNPDEPEAPGSRAGFYNVLDAGPNNKPHGRSRSMGDILTVAAAVKPPPSSGSEGQPYMKFECTRSRTLSQMRTAKARRIPPPPSLYQDRSFAQSFKCFFSFGSPKAPSSLVTSQSLDILPTIADAPQKQSSIYSRSVLSALWNKVKNMKFPGRCFGKQAVIIPSSPILKPVPSPPRLGAGLEALQRRNFNGINVATKVPPVDYHQLFASYGATYV
ncbi:uncharacterized protein LAJ45_07245 [Morchella importuna]|uniref:uncharacterized protein n=1 Tax=Morchella importuna TaxID=1174673 RepID=UPI001E8CE228|nr:uncharacterized protein LAJ45_07245 [Morchella importuna]KAH8148534.1 hypothetical protein LAJ45_07245 [Morchella importuna]